MQSKTSVQQQQEFSQRGTTARGIIPATQRPMLSALRNTVTR
jgi:hypothetical protein